MQFSAHVRNARNDAIETAIGASAILLIRTGNAPVNCAAADSGIVLASITLPVVWAAPSDGGVKLKSGLWQTITALETGTPGHFRIYDSAGIDCHMQGSVGSNPLGGFDMTISTATITVGQTVTVTGFAITDGNA